jgi:hypothetical protein
MARLVGMPRLQSAFAETLRLRIAVGLSRFRDNDDADDGGDDDDDDNKDNDGDNDGGGGGGDGDVGGGSGGDNPRRSSSSYRPYPADAPAAPTAGRSGAKKRRFRLLGKWRLPAREHVLVFSFTAAMNRRVWNARAVAAANGGGNGGGGNPNTNGTDDDDDDDGDGDGKGRVRPVEEFWAERFLVYPPRRQCRPPPCPPPATQRRGAEAEHAQKAPEADQKQQQPRFSLAGLAGAWVPFGGELHVCPGRHFAKREVIGAFAVLCQLFDLELLRAPDTGALPAPVPPDTSFYAVGALPPKGKVPFRMRRRRRRRRSP